MVNVFMATILVVFAIPCFADENEKTVAIEKVREWDRGRESTLNLTAEELKRRQQATERVAETMQRKIDQQYAWEPTQNDRIRAWVDQVQTHLSHVSTYLTANLLRSKQNLARYKDLSKESKRLFDTIIMAHENERQFQAAGNFPSDMNALRDLDERIRKLAFDLAMEKWDEDMALRY